MQPQLRRLLLWCRQLDSESFRELNAPSALLRSAAVVRFRFWLATALALSAIITTLLHAQVSDEENRKREAFLKTRAEEPASPEKSPSPAAKPKSAKSKSKTGKSASPTPKPKPKPTKSPTPAKRTSSESTKTTGAEDEETPAPKSKKSPTAKSKKSKKTSAKKSASPAPKKKRSKSKRKPSPTPGKSAQKSEQAEEKAPTPSPAASAPRAIAVPVPTAPPVSTSAILSDAPTEEPEQLTIEKYGYGKPRGFWARVFGGGGRRSRSGAGYRYLTRSVRAEIDRAAADRRNPRWQRIVVHNSGTRQGNARVFDYYHRRVRRMRNGLAYHFVIGNGTSTGNGQIEVGDRWRRQINGGHVHSDYLNNIALGICLVGDFNRDQPTRAQLESCEELIRYLRQLCGKTDNRFALVQPHREANPPRWGTDCPGDVFPYSWFRRFRE